MSVMSNKRALRTGTAGLAALALLSIGLGAAQAATSYDVSTISGFGAPADVAVAPSLHRAYVANYVGGSNSVSVINTTNDQVVGGPIGVGDQPIGVATSPDDARVYVANYSGASVSVIDTATNVVIATVEVGTKPVAIAVNADSTRAYVTNQDSNTVSVIEASTNSVVDTIDVGSGPDGIALVSGTASGYVSNGLDGTVSVIDTDTDAVVGDPIVVGGSPGRIDVDPATHQAFTGDGNKTVAVIDTATNQAKGTIPAGGGDVVVDSARHTVYALDPDSNTVAVIDTTTDDVTATVDVGDFPYGAGLDAQTHKLYVANLGGGSVSVIDPMQQIDFTTAPPKKPTVGSTYDVAATGGDSGNPVTFTVDPSTTNNACTVTDNGDSTGTVSFDHVGSCVIDADQAAGNDFDAAPQVQQSINVAKGTQRITFSTEAPKHATVGETYDVAATGGGTGKRVIFSATAQDEAQNVCTVTDNRDGTAVVSFTGAGRCVVNARQKGSDDYAQAPLARQRIVVRPAGNNTRQR